MRSINEISWVRNKGFYKNGNQTTRISSKVGLLLSSSLTCFSRFYLTWIRYWPSLMKWRSRFWWWRPFVILEELLWSWQYRRTYRSYEMNHFFCPGWRAEPDFAWLDRGWYCSWAGMSKQFLCWCYQKRRRRGCISFVLALVIRDKGYIVFPNSCFLEQEHRNKIVIRKYTANSDPARFDESNEFFASIPATLLFNTSLAATNLPLAVYTETGTNVCISFPFIMLKAGAWIQYVRTSGQCWEIIDSKACVVENNI